MTHVDEGIVVALRDGESVDDASRAHVEGCASCRTALLLAERRQQAIEELLTGSTIDVDVEAAKALVRARLDAERAQERRRGFGGVHLRRAAAIIALTAGAAYALPRSPISGWLGIGGPEAAVSDGTGTAITTQESAEGTILIGAANGIDIVINGVTPGTEVEVVWLAGETARIAGGADAVYSVGDGRAEVTVTGGPVRVGVPRSASPISITINGRMVFQGSSTDAQVTDVSTRSDDRIVFLAPEPL